MLVELNEAALLLVNEQLDGLVDWPVSAALEEGSGRATEVAEKVAGIDVPVNRGEVQACTAPSSAPLGDEVTTEVAAVAVAVVMTDGLAGLPRVYPQVA